MLAVSALLPDAQAGHPPAVLVHGAANSAGIWRFWQQALAERGWASFALDLRGHGRSGPHDLSTTSMRDYAADVCSLTVQLRPPPVLLGWSMGGLVALMAAAEAGAAACVCLAPSAPAPQADVSIAPRAGEFGPEEYGLTGDVASDERAMPDLDGEERQIARASLGRESRWARDERQAGIVVAAVRCPLLIVTGTADRSWPLSRYRDVPLAAGWLSVEGASHWGLVLNRRALAMLVPAVTRWLEERIQSIAGQA